jgi:hypothetical protein
VQGMRWQGTGNRRQPITDTDVPAPAKLRTTTKKSVVSVTFMVQAAGSMWITPSVRPKSIESPDHYGSLDFRPACEEPAYRGFVSAVIDLRPCKRPTSSVRSATLAIDVSN